MTNKNKLKSTESLGKCVCIEVRGVGARGEHSMQKVPYVSHLQCLTISPAGPGGLWVLPTKSEQ